MGLWNSTVRARCKWRLASGVYKLSKKIIFNLEKACLFRQLDYELKGDMTGFFEANISRTIQRCSLRRLNMRLNFKFTVNSLYTSSFPGFLLIDNWNGWPWRNLTNYLQLVKRLARLLCQGVTYSRFSSSQVQAGLL